MRTAPKVQIVETAEEPINTGVEKIQIYSSLEVDITPAPCHYLAAVVILGGAVAVLTIVMMLVN